MSGWKSSDTNANNKPSYITHTGRDQLYTNVYGNNTILVTASRLANANVTVGMSTKQTSHTGWVHVEKGTGSLSGVAVSNVNSKVYSTEFLTIVGANTNSQTPLVAANVQMVVTGSNTISFVVNSTGSGFTAPPTVTASAANNSTLIFTATTNGRSGRIQTEVLVALSSPVSSNTINALPWYTGV